MTGTPGPETDAWCTCGVCGQRYRAGEHHSCPRVRQAANALTFRCPGCGDHHTVNTDRWQWNGSLDRPTFSPSLLVQSGHYAPSHKAGEPCWCGTQYGFYCYRCHSFIRDGRIEFLSDCTHALAGKTVELDVVKAPPPLTASTPT